MSEAGFKFAGQTEFFADRCGAKNFAMCLTGGKLTVALVTTHIPLSQVSGTLERPEIVRVGLLLVDLLHRRSINAPRIAVAGLNPHAGESGKIGREEIEIIAPAVAELQSAIGNRSQSGSDQSALFDGPLSPDTVFRCAAVGEFDAVLCLSHDQALIPVQPHPFDRGVQVAL